MIIKNPYGFISKHYKIINLLLLVPMLYLLLKFGDIATFFKDYIRASYSTPETNYADKYVTLLTTVVILFMFIINLFLYIILLTKKRKNIYFLLNVGYSIVLLISALLSHTTMVGMESGSVDQTFINFVRDFANISRFPMYILLIIGASEGVGFNFKTLKFDNNADLQIHEDDEEEIEIRLSNENNNNFKKNFIHMIRELKYYILENKFVFLCFTGLFIIVIGVSLFLNFQVYNKSYTVKQAFSLDNFTLSVKESYITKVDFRGLEINSDKYFLALKLGIQNNGQPSKIDKSNFRIYIGDEVLYPSYDRSSRFIDIGKPYQGQDIPHNDENNPAEDYVFVYELTEKQVKGSYQLRILNTLTKQEDKLIGRYKTVNIRPQTILKNEDIGTVGIGKEISLENTLLNETSYKLNDFEIVTSYPYTSRLCDMNKNCTNVNDVIVPHGGSVLVVLSDDIKWDETTSYYKNSNKDFYTDFVYIQYEYSYDTTSEPKLYQAKMKNVTPSTVTDKKIYEVPNSVFYSNKYNMIIRVRNKIATISLKE